MTLVCIRPFGNFDVGDEIEVEDGAEFDHYHFEQVPDSTSKAEKN